MTVSVRNCLDDRYAVRPSSLICIIVGNPGSMCPCNVWPSMSCASAFQGRDRPIIFAVEEEDEPRHFPIGGREVRVELQRCVDCSRGFGKLAGDQVDVAKRDMRLDIPRPQRNGAPGRCDRLLVTL